MRWLKHWWQRKTRGFDDSELWNLDVTIAMFIFPRLREFRRQAISLVTPMEFIHCPEEWEFEINKMIHTFQLISLERDTPEDIADINAGLEAFAKFYHTLWW